MDLTLNRDHPLCNRNLLFATFGTGGGGQVLDLSDRPSHGTMVHGAATPQIIRSLTSDVPPGFPTDYQSLGVRSSAAAYAEFNNPSKVTSLTTTITAAMWVRPYDLSTNHCVPLSLGIGGTSGWSLLTSCRAGTGNWIDNAWGMSITSTSGGDNLRVSNIVLPLSQWSLVAFTFGPTSPQVKLYTNGVQSGISFTTTDGNMSSGSYLRLGTYISGPNYPPRCDIGPTMIWGSVLTADEVALLYRDTWGMVSQERMSLPMMVAAGATTTTTTLAASRPTLGGRGFGSPYIGGYRPGFMRKD